MHRTLKKLTSERDDVIARIVPYFRREALPAGTTLWRRNDPSSFACIVEKGGWVDGWNALHCWSASVKGVV